MTSSSSIDPTRARWESFLDKLETRQRELLSQSAQALPLLVELRRFDPIPFTNALTAVRVQCGELIHKIDKTWSTQVEAAFEAALGDAADRYAVLDQERERGAERRRAMEQAQRRAEVEIAAAAARRILDEARQVLERQFACTQCQAPLPVRAQFFRSYYVTCDYCRTVNTFEPGMIARSVEFFAVHALAEEEALPAHLALLDAEQRRASALERTKLYRDYVEIYLRARVRWIPEYERDLEKDRQAKLDAFIQSIA
ncbi:MAG TPA: hypothetical protein VFF06_36580 [Polyangia bacterium]|nr:hypothetical protein [Polyangia bacterium]